MCLTPIQGVGVGRTFLLVALIILFHPSLARASIGFDLSMESLLAPLGKRVEVIKENGQKREISFGRETTEFIGVSGFTDLNINWRVLFGLQASLVGAPILKGTGGIAFMINTPYTLHLRPHLFVGLDPILSMNPEFPPFGFTMHAGLGLDYVWDNVLYTHFALKVYLLKPYGEEAENRLQTQWLAGTISISGGLGYLF